MGCLRQELLREDSPNVYKGSADNQGFVATSVIKWKSDLFDGDGPDGKRLKRLYKWEENLLRAVWKEHLTVPPVTTPPLL